MARNYDTVSFLSDYGLADEFVGVVKAVIRERAPHALVLDITHGIAPFDVRGGSLALARSVQYLPSGVVLAVVDPGVGTDRRAVAVEIADGEGVVVGPDNGLLGPAVAMAGGSERAVVLTNADFHLVGPGDTFAGRDVFAPVAAALCNGVDLAELGELVDANDLLPGVVPLPRDAVGGGFVAEVLWVDRFGNVQLNLGPDDLDGWPTLVQLRWGDGEVRSARTVRAYGDIGTGACGLVLDSYGMYSVCLDRHSAAAELGLRTGSEVTVAPLDDVPGRSTPVRLTRR